ncbi:MAG: PRC-barrel domain-containing protein [Chitinophagales bacterium]|nr:PRC-barrel domain-containing protein [Hyphomicrobiales bacterium]
MAHHAHSSNMLISSESVEDTKVYGSDADKIGSIHHLMIEKTSGQVVYAVVEFGGFLGLGRSHYPLPWSAIRYDSELEGYRTNVTEDQLKNAPDFDDESYTNRDWETRTHSHYGTQPYWSNPSINR